MEYETAIGHDAPVPHPRAGEPLRPPAQRRGGTPSEEPTQARGTRAPVSRSAAEIDLSAPDNERQVSGQLPEPLTAPTHEIPVSDEQRALGKALSGHHGDATGEPEDAKPESSAEHGQRVPEWGEDAQSRAERERPMNFGDAPASIHEHSGPQASGHTEIQSGAPVAEHEAATEVQAGDQVAPGDTLDVNIQDQNDTAAAGTMAAISNMSRWGEPAEWRPKGGWRPDPRFGEVLTAAQSEGPLGRLMTVGRQLRLQIEGLPPEIIALVSALAAGDEHARAAGFAVALHLDQDYHEQWWLYTNLGPGAVLPPGVQVPKWLRLGYEHARVDPQIQALMFGHADPVVMALHHYAWFARGWAEHGRRHALIGIVSTLPVSTEASRFGQKANDHLRGEHAADAPVIVQAEGVGQVPALEHPAHVLELFEPDTHAAIRRALESYWSEATKALVPQWIAQAVEYTAARGRPAFTAITAAIRAGEQVGYNLIQEAQADASVIAVTMWQMLARGLEQPEHMGLTRFGPFLSGYNAQLAALALDRWAQGQDPHMGQDHGWVYDIAYLAAKITGNGTWIAQSLPDLNESPWKRRQT